MPVSDGYLEHVRELLAQVGPVRTRRMFGGAGVYRDDLMFALVIDETLYFKTDEESRRVWSAAGSEPFTFTYRDGRTETMSYWRLPASALDDADETQRWARLGLDAALRARRPKKRKASAVAEALGPGPWVGS